ncbi:nucleoid-associated protein [Loigolactobacillus jiayinensis]|uniref:Nucleoid-associated protein n=1 Tax=Loigolactobacillus jiayinensis TaxID=2486016 RepID=A0ABW1RET7_9LACO|nr:nucleoid-associated protein [Loigolactobacillus jiayinensis]
MQINQAILHIVDPATATAYYSEQVLDLAEAGIAQYIEQLCTRFLRRDNQNGTLPAANPVLQLCQPTGDFITVSQQLARRFFDFTLQHSDIVSGDLLLAQLTDNERDYWAILKLNQRQDFIHYLNYDEQAVANQIVLNQAVLPAVGQAITEGVMIDQASGQYFLADKAYEIDGEKRPYVASDFLQVTAEPTLTSSVKQVRQAVNTVAEKFNQDPVTVTADLKQAVYQSLSDTNTLDVDYVSDQVFKENPTAKAEFEQQVTAAKVPRQKADLTHKFEAKVSKQKFKLDNGIELIVPVDIYQNRDLIEFVNNPDGTISVLLKNINAIQNKF